MRVSKTDAIAGLPAELDRTIVRKFRGRQMVADAVADLLEGAGFLLADQTSIDDVVDEQYDQLLSSHHMGGFCGHSPRPTWGRSVGSHVSNRNEHSGRLGPTGCGTKAARRPEPGGAVRPVAQRSFCAYQGATVPQG
jgi:hypothetical protein